MDPIEMKQQLVVHAPPVPAFFEPIMQEPEPNIPDTPQIVMEEYESRGEGALASWDSLIIDDASESLKSLLAEEFGAHFLTGVSASIMIDYARGVQRFRVQHLIWKQRQLEQRFAQWPIYYANLVFPTVVDGHWLGGFSS